MNINIETLKEGDWMECRGNSLLSKMIRLRSGTSTNHGQPIHRGEDGVLYCLDMEFPRMRVSKLENEIRDAINKDFDFYICRQKYQVPGSNYVMGAQMLETDLAARRPFYAIWDLVRYLFGAGKAKACYNKLINIAMEDVNFIVVKRITMGSDEKVLFDYIRNNYDTTNANYIGVKNVNDEGIKAWNKFKVSFDKIGRTFYYCTLIWKDIWITAGEDVFKKLYNVDCCTPVETEKFSREHAAFISGYFDGIPSDELWRMVVSGK